MAVVDPNALSSLRKKIFGDPSTAGIISRNNLVNAIYTELVDKIQTHNIPTHGILTEATASTVLPLASGGNQYGIDAARLQNLQTPETFEVNNFIKSSTDVSVDNIIDTLLAIVYKMTSLRRASWYLILDPNNPTATVKSDPYLTMLDLEAQVWYNEMNELSRRYNMDTGQDIIGSNGTSTGENDAYEEIEDTGVIKTTAYGIPVDFNNVSLRPFCIKKKGMLALANESDINQLTDSLGDPVFCAYDDTFRLIQLNDSFVPKKLYVVQNPEDLANTFAARSDYAVVISTSARMIYDGAAWVTTTSLKNLDGLGTLTAGSYQPVLAINAYSVYDPSRGNPPTMLEHKPGPGVYQLIKDLRDLLFIHRDTSPVVDIGQCHANCHSNCHGSRNRR